ncbi:MAG: DUF4282 domain-containing protein [Erysipelotrichaceae bacterium]|nr:DUF4282 domain-containing protein [Erysipelotrichaceae bacterium]
MEKVKKIKRMRLFGILSIIVGLFLMLGSGSDFVGVVFLIAAIVIFVVGIVLVSTANKKGKTICMQCGASLFGCAYEYYELSTTKDSRGDEKTTVEFSATCPECGAEKTFTKKYTSYIAAKFSNGRQTVKAERINIEPKVKKDAKKYFGH